MEDRTVVYTMAIGGDYDLCAVDKSGDCDFICFTDQPQLKSNGWSIRNISTIIPSDTVRSSRDFKIRPHRWLGDYTRSIYVDSTVQLTGTPEALWDHLVPHKNTVFGGFSHSYRDNIQDEFEAVRQANLDFHSVLDSQLEAYETHSSEVLSAKPTWGGVLARRHNDPSCIEAMEIWFANVLRFSRRDQLSLPLALSALRSDQVHVVDDNIFESDLHRWPVNQKIRPNTYTVENGPSELRGLTRMEDNNQGRRRNRMFEKIFKRSRSLSKQKPALPDTKFGFDANYKLHFAEDIKNGDRVYVSDEKRLELYKGGIEARQEWIRRDYRLPADLVRQGDVILDVGANVGELGIWAKQRDAQYIAFEPDPVAFAALKLNVPTAQTYDVALSDSNGTAKFFLSTAEADSSLFEPSHTSSSIEVRMSTLDSFLEENSGPSHIRLLKVEAEGMEVEVLSGALKTLSIVEYIAVDAGPERGGENTVPGVLRILTEAGFEVLDCFLLRGTFLLRKAATKEP